MWPAMCMLMTHPTGRRAVNALVNSQREDPSPAVVPPFQACYGAQLASARAVCELSERLGLQRPSSEEREGFQAGSGDVQLFCASSFPWSMSHRQWPSVCLFNQLGVCPDCQP